MGRRNVYNPQSMKNAASQIEKQLADFDRSKAKIDEIISHLNHNWDDSENRRYVSNYNNHAKKIADDLSKNMHKIQYLYEQCAKRYGDAISNGNSQFNS